MQSTNHLSYFENASANWVQYRKNRSYYWDSITEYCAYFIHPSQKVLEIGCGSGELIGCIEADDRTGVDFCEPLLQIARQQHPQVKFHLQSAETLQLDGQFDVIILSNLIGWLNDIEETFNRLRPLCHAQTRIVVTYYSKLWEPLINLAEWMGMKRRTPEQNWLSNADIANVLYLAGFETYRHQRHMLFPLRIPLLSGFTNRYLSRLPIINALSINQYVFARPLPIPHQHWQTQYSVSVVIPARNEAGNIEQAILRVPHMGKHTEIIFVEGNSTDQTWAEILRISEKHQSTRTIRAFRQEGKGKGDAVRKGYAEATGDILMILDADLTVMPEDLPKFYKAMATGKGEFINGVRLVYPMEKGAMRTLNTIGNHFFSRLFSWMLERPIKDTLCGTKVMFRRDYIRLTDNRRFFGEFDPFGDFDLIFGAYKLNLKIIDLPIRYKERTYGETNISRFRHGFLLLKMSFFAALKIKFR